MALNRQMAFQVTMPALVVALAMFGTSLLGIRSINRLQTDRDKILSDHGRSLQAAQDLETYLRRMRFHSLMYVMDLTPDRLAKVEHDQADFEQALETVRVQEATREKQAIIAAIETGYLQYRNDLQRSAQSPPGPEVDNYLKWADGHPIRYVVAPCEELIELNRRELADTVEESVRQSDRARLWMVALAAFGAIGGLVGGFGVAWGLSRSITRLNVRLQDVHAHLDREVASLRLTAEGGDLHKMERQVGTILERVRAVICQLQRQEREAIRAEQLAAVGQLAAGIAHEVRNPLTSIKLLVGAALNGRYPNGLSSTDLRVIHDEVGRLERKVQGLLDFARPLETIRRPEDLNAIIRRVVDLVQERSRQQSVAVNLELPGEPQMADVDRDQLQSVLTNLTINALDALPGGGRIDVGLTLAANGEVNLTVADSGPGIPLAVVDRLFTPFVSTKPTGTGLGLSLSRRIIQGHGGRLTAENRPVGGALFTISLPTASGGVAGADIVDRR